MGKLLLVATLVFGGCANDVTSGGDGLLPENDGLDQAGRDATVADRPGAMDAPVSLSDGASKPLSDGAPGADTGVGTLSLVPADATLDVTAGGPAKTLVYTAIANTGNGPMDVSALATFAVEDPTLGGFAGHTFTSNVDHGGTSTVRATFMNLTGTATLHVRLHAQVAAPDCPGCPPFPALPAMACADPATAPQLVYPPDGVLLPPNMTVIQIQFLPGANNNLWEVDFENAATDVRVETKCNPITDSRGLATGGCSYDVDPKVWAFIAQSNRGGDPLAVTVRGEVQGAPCVSGSNTRAISFATEDLDAGLYYWQSVVINGVQGKTGGIYRYDFGKPGQAGAPFLVPNQQNSTCIGCHFLSRDGKKMSFGADDADADDEYGDLKASLLDVQTKAISAGGKVSPGFQTFSHDHALLLASDGRGMNKTPAFDEFDGNTGAALGKVATGNQRATQPDWSADDRRVVFVAPATFFCMKGTACANGDDEHFAGGSLMSMVFDPLQRLFGAITPLVPSAGENNYYPSLAPDGQVLAFDRAPAGKGVAGDAFSNLGARVQILSLTRPGAAPVDAANLNLGDGLTNSWPRFSPFVHAHKGGHIAWITFSSTRDYGLRVRNAVKVPQNGGLIDQVNCYPPESPENPNGSKLAPLAPNCHQPQIWMAAVDLDKGAAGVGDPSWPAFWLPFQDPQAHNHIAQWVETVVGEPPPDGGVPDAAAPDMGAARPDLAASPDLASHDVDMAPACVPLFSPCADGGAACCVGECYQGTCAIPPS